jgi:hypothetical protein
MKHIVRLFSALSLLIFIVPVGSSGSTLGENYILFGINEYDYNYSESAPPNSYSDTTSTHSYLNPPSILDREYGATAAFHLEGKVYSHDRSFPWYGGFQLEYGGGIQTYNGGPLDSVIINSAGDTTQVFPQILDYKSNTFMRAGFFVGPFFRTGNCLIGLNAGLLYYNWYRGTGAYNESYTWLYLPLGAEIQWDLNGRLSAGLDLQYRIMLSGSMQATYDYQSVILGEPTTANQFTLGTRDGFYLGIPIQLQIDREFGLEWKPWFELRPSGLSGEVYTAGGGGYVEPNSTSYSIGMSVSVMFGTFSSMAQSR